MQDQPVILTAAEVAALLRISLRTLERRHSWQPAFPAPLTRRPLTWTRQAVLEWVAKREAQQQRRAA
jgi:predicted DNA-binding transcriptional regulator AlpA